MESKELVASKKKKTINMMRLNILIIIFLLVFQSTFSQVNKDVKSTTSSDTIRALSFDPTFFVLGTLSDYTGRFQYVDREKQVDRYYPFEKPLVNYLTKYINTELNIAVDTIFEKSNHCKMFSDELSNALNSFYGVKDELLNNKYETKKQIYSFLAGVYCRYGDKLDSSIYKIQLANSPKHQNCYEFLKQIGCENIFFQYLRNIPAQFILYFEPTDELKRYLDSIEFERVILNKSFNNQIVEMMQEHMTKKEKEEMDEALQKSRNGEIEKIKNAFKR